MQPAARQGTVTTLGILQKRSFCDVLDNLYTATLAIFALQWRAFPPPALPFPPRSSLPLAVDRPFLQLPPAAVPLASTSPTRLAPTSKKKRARRCPARALAARSEPDGAFAYSPRSARPPLPSLIPK